MAEMSPELRLPMARETYLAYVSAHPRLRNSRYALYCKPDDRRDFKHFLGVVDKCGTLGVDPVEYVTGVMGKHMRCDPADVIARDLDNSARIGEYVAASAESEISYETQWRELEHRLGTVVGARFEGVVDAATARTAVENELCSTRRNYEDWFRALYLDPLSDAVIEIYGDSAASQFMAGRSLRVFAAHIRPGVYRAFMTKCGLQHVLAYDEAN